MDNISKIATSEICQRCAKCCKEFGELVDYDTAFRFKLLNSDKIVVEEINTNNNIFYRVTYKFPCSKLIKKRDGKYYCLLYENKEFARPHMCKVYPDNIPLSLIETEKKECPALVNFANANFASQKETNKGLTEADASKKSSSFLMNNRGIYRDNGGA